MLRVYKFGGASVKDAKAIKNIEKIISEHPSEELLIVVSAMGKTTNKLQDIANLRLAGVVYKDQMCALIADHEEICLELFQNVPLEIRALEANLGTALQAPQEDVLAFQDSVIAFGELFSTAIIAKYLGAKYLDARHYVRTDETFTEAEVDWSITSKFIKKDLPQWLSKGVVVTQGFIGSTSKGQTTTLGREGSDFSAAIFANCLGAESLTVWKDVPGLLNADPKIFPKAEKFDHISYQEVIEMTYYGAKVIHPKTIHPLAMLGIPLYVRSFLTPDESGTEISEHERLGRKTCYVFKENQLLVSVRVRDNSFMDERKMSFILQALAHLNIKANLTHNSALTFTFCMDDNAMKRDKIVDYLKEEFQVLYNENLWLATIKNYDSDSFSMLPKNMECIIEEKTRNNYQVVYKLV